MLNTTGKMKKAQTLTGWTPRPANQSRRRRLQSSQLNYPGWTSSRHLTTAEGTDAINITEAKNTAWAYSSNQIPTDGHALFWWLAMRLKLFLLGESSAVGRFTQSSIRWNNWGRWNQRLHTTWERRSVIGCKMNKWCMTAFFRIANMSGQTSMTIYDAQLIFCISHPTWGDNQVSKPKNQCKICFRFAGIARQLLLEGT